jgi:hypothetical protein
MRKHEGLKARIQMEYLNLPPSSILGREDILNGILTVLRSGTE